ncbi:MAG: hypothetical protein QM751_13775 [Paludibacteraceae bacterium]
MADTEKSIPIKTLGNIYLEFFQSSRSTSHPFRQAKYTQSGTILDANHFEFVLFQLWTAG